MMKKYVISQNDLEQLLDWLNSDRDLAGQKYELVRNRLIKIFYARGCSVAEDLADETIDRVARKIEKLSATYKGDPSLYFYAVGKKVFLEYTRRPKTEELPQKLVKEATADGENEIYFECLDKCFSKISSDKQQLIVGYYESEKRDKIENRKKLGELLGVSNEALRVRALRIRQILQNCVIECIQGKTC